MEIKIEVGNVYLAHVGTDYYDYEVIDIIKGLIRFKIYGWKKVDGFLQCEPILYGKRKRKLFGIISYIERI